MQTHNPTWKRLLSSDTLCLLRQLERTHNLSTKVHIVIGSLQDSVIFSDTEMQEPPHTHTSTQTQPPVHRLGGHPPSQRQDTHRESRTPCNRPARVRRRGSTPLRQVHILRAGDTPRSSKADTLDTPKRHGTPSRDTLGSFSCARTSAHTSLHTQTCSPGVTPSFRNTRV